jgi:hypothetical protein
MKGRRGGRVSNLVGFTTTHAISSDHHQSWNPAHGQVYSIQLYEIKIDSDLR